MPFRASTPDPSTKPDRTSEVVDTHPIYSGYDDRRAATIATPNTVRSLIYPRSMPATLSIELESELSRRVTEMAQTGSLDDAAYAVIDRYLGAVLAQQSEGVEHAFTDAADTLDAIHVQIVANLDETLSQLDRIGRELDNVDGAYRDARNALLNITITPSWRTPPEALTSGGYELKGTTSGEQAHLIPPGGHE